MYLKDTIHNFKTKRATFISLAILKSNPKLVRKSSYLIFDQKYQNLPSSGLKMLIRWPKKNILTINVFY